MIIVQLSGGMGNQMFQYAFGRYLSLKHEVPLKLDLSVLLDRTPRPVGSTAVFREYDLSIFALEVDFAKRNDIPFLFRSYFSGKTKLLFNSLRSRLIPNSGKEIKNGRFDSSAKLLGPNAYIEGHWQSEKYFSEIAAVICSDFKIKNPLSEKTQQLYKDIQNKTSVCVHVRRTDYLSISFHGTLGQEYYDKGIAYIAARTTIDYIYVFSDDIAWCKENLRFSFPVVFVEDIYAGEKSREHFALMMACTHFVIPNSSFSWWAAWLSTNPSKIVVAPKIWFHDKTLPVDDVVPSEWIRL